MPRLFCPSCSSEVDARDPREVCPGCSKPLVPSRGTVVERTGRETLREQGPTKSPAPSDVPRAAASPVSSKQFGRFELRSVLGRGAFGQVFRAHDPRLDREVAVKIPKLGSGRGTIERFLREGKAAAKLHHPNIVPTYESGRLEGRYYIASQFVEGETLAERIARGSISLRDAAQWIRELASGLAYAHEQRVIHRDVKPANIMLDRQGRPRLMDFGLAKRLTEDASQTIDGTLMGTPAYMAPEQARRANAEVGPAADQYSLGVVLYELLAGRTPFEGSSHLQVAQAIAAEPPPPRTFRPEIPVDLQAICLKTLSKNPAARYESAAELAEDLGRWLRGESTLARPVSAPERAVRWARRNPAIAALSVAVALALVSGTIVSAAFAYRANVVSIAEAKARADAEGAASRAERETAKAAAAQAKAEAEAEAARKAEEESAAAKQRAETEAAAARAAEALAGEASMREAKEAAAAKDAGTLAATEAAAARAAEERAAAEATTARAAEKEALHAFALASVEQAAVVAERGDVAEALLMYAEAADAASRSDDPELARALSINIAAWEPYCPTVEAAFNLPSMPVNEGWNAFGFANEDRQVVVNSGGSDVWVWNADDPNAPPRTLTHPARVAGVAAWRELPRAVTVCDDGQFRVWDLARSSVLASGAMRDGNDPIRFGGEYAKAKDTRICLDDAGSYFALTEPSSQENDLYDGASRVFSSSGKQVAQPDGLVRGFDAEGRLISIERREGAQMTPAHVLVFGNVRNRRSQVLHILSKNNSKSAAYDVVAVVGDLAALVGRPDGGLTLMSLRTDSFEGSVLAESDTRAALSPAGDFLLADSRTSMSTSLYRTRPFEFVARLPGRPRGGSTFARDGASFLASSESAEGASVRRYRVPRIGQLTNHLGDGPAVVAKFSPDGSNVAAIFGTRDRTLRVWSLTEDRVLAERRCPATLPDRDDGNLHDVDFVLDGSAVLFGYDNQLWAWRFAVPGAEPAAVDVGMKNKVTRGHSYKQGVYVPHEPTYEIESARFVATDPATGVVTVLSNAEDTGAVARVNDKVFRSNLFAVYPDQGFLAARVAAGAELSPRGSLAPCRDSRTAAIVGKDSMEILRLKSSYETKTYRPGDLSATIGVESRIEIPRLRSDRAHVVALDPRGQRLAYDDESGKATEYDVGAASTIGVLMRHEGEATCLRYDLSGSYLIVGANDGAVTVCDVKSGHRVGPRFVHGGPILSLDLSDDGRWVVVGDQTGRISVWPIPSAVAEHPADPRAYVRRVTGLKRAEGAVPGEEAASVVSTSREEWLAASADDANRFKFVEPVVASPPVIDVAR